ncbi:MAG: ABC transporter substrate-binding protein [Rickettsiales bacterium]|jgi:ABC-type transporter MlaC component|nr:ABC transporter substrate-binding protein [Rickettsiales bacterium]
MAANRFIAIVFLLFFASWSVTGRGSDDNIRDFLRLFFVEIDKINRHGKLKKREAEFLVLANNNIDIDWIANFILGKHRKNLSIEQRNRFIDTYSKYLVSNYRSIFSIYSDNGYEIISVAEQQGGKVFMVSAVLSLNGKTVRNNFRVVQKNGKYYITDVITEGISFISAKRAEVEAAMASKGFDNFMGELELSLTTKNKK